MLIGLDMGNAWRLAVGTFTRFPVPAPDRVDRRIAGRAMAMAPAVGGVLAGLTGLPLLGVGVLGAVVGSSTARAFALGLLAAVLSVAATAWATRGLHLDGMADTADGLGGGHTPEQVQRIARASDIGPFGVVTVVLVLMTQVASLAALLSIGMSAGATPSWTGGMFAWVAWIVAAVLARLCATLACVGGGPLRAARDEGLGALVAGSVTPSVAVGWGAIVLGVIAVAGLTSGVGAAVLLVAMLIAAGAGLVTIAVSARRFGGLTGDVLGAGIEVSATATLVAACFAIAVWQALAQQSL